MVQVAFEAAGRQGSGCYSDLHQGSRDMESLPRVPSSISKLTSKHMGAGGFRSLFIFLARVLQVLSNPSETGRK